MRWCFENARAFVMTSRVEACPNIALEAMVAGAVIVSADNPPLPEIFDDAALFTYASGSASTLAQRIAAVDALSADARATAMARSKARARSFDWARTADRTIEVLWGAAHTPR